MISVKDLGFIKWDESTRHFDVVADNLIVPMEVSYFSEIESSFFTAELDTLREIINPVNKIYNFALPTRLNCSFKKEIVQNLNVYLRSNIVPHIPQKIKEKLRFVKKFGILNS